MNMDPIVKIHVIHAVENGRSKAEIAREFGLQPHNIAYIYQQKDAIIKKYAQKYNALNDVRCINLDQSLLDWLQLQINSGQIVQEHELLEKALEIGTTLSDDTIECFDDWIQEFQTKHSIVKYKPEIECSNEAKRDWVTFLGGVDVKDVYVSGMCGLFHSLTLEDFGNQKDTKDYVCLLFMFSCLGVDKRELVVAGTDQVNRNDIRSLPVTYFNSEKPQFNHSILQICLHKWSADLQAEGRNVVLLINLPNDVIDDMAFANIKLVSSTNMFLIIKCAEKITESFKYHYRRLQMTKTMLSENCLNELDFIDYLHLMSVAWEAVSKSYIQMLFFPPENGSLYFKSSDYCNHTLSHWYKKHNFKVQCNGPIDHLLDGYVTSDKHVYTFSIDKINADVEYVNDSLLKNECGGPSGIQAYQAIKRLVSYLQSENGDVSVMKSAKNLENHLEYGMVLDIHNFINEE